MADTIDEEGRVRSSSGELVPVPQQGERWADRRDGEQVTVTAVSRSFRSGWMLVVYRRRGEPENRNEARTLIDFVDSFVPWKGSN